MPLPENSSSLENKPSTGGKILKKGCIGTAIALAVVVVLVICFFDRIQALSDRHEEQYYRDKLGNIAHIHGIYVPDRSGSASSDMSARFEVDGKGSMTLWNLDTDSFSNSNHLWLAGIGQFAVRSRGFDPNGQEYSGWAIDLGPEGPLAINGLSPITSVQDAVNHYDQIMALVVKWPVIEKEWPDKTEEIHLKDAKGKDFYFALKRITEPQ
jgi:hypothetical protein